jgi:ATP-binding cassette subfamily C (CFTR/MRP) protein 1
LETLGLDGVCEEGSFSAGEKQLMCFARALLRKTAKIVLLDEISANCDSETDAIIQRLITEEFRDRTVLIIAHRLASIMKVMEVSSKSEL